ncbi:MAG: hypothetical protein JWP89_3030 [Schlesneria sp.]|nr:hypothetical protein [Schlesneria sp.]
MNARQSVCIGLLLALIAGFVHAQEPTRPPVADATTPANPMKVATDSEKRPALDSLLTVIRFVLNKQGDPVPVPANLTLEDVIEMLKPPGRTERESVPAASISSLELTGEANDERATLKAKVVVQLRQATEFVKVPLQFNEAILIDARYTGEGEAVYEERKDRDQGITYWFRGPNPHSIELTLSVPVRRQLPTRKLQLTLPSSPVARLKLLVPYSSVTAKVSEKASDDIPLEVTTLGKDKSAIEMIGLANRMDLSWQPNPEAAQSELALEANTTILAQVDTDTVLLDVRQRLQSLQGKFDSFAVQLPPNAEVLKIEDDLPPRESRSDGYRDHKTDPTKPNRVLVSLTKATVGPVRLRWTVRLPRAEKRKLSLTGFAVESARKQSGEVGLAPHDGLRLSTVQYKDGNILRINAGELKPDIGGIQVTQAYRFLNQPFNLVVGVDPIEPYYLVEPKIFLMGAAHQLTMEAAFHFQVYREGLTEVSFLWPERKSEGWIIDGFDPPELVETAPIEEDQGLIRVRLIKRQTAPFTVRMRARRPTRGTEDIALTLPRAKASSPPIPSLYLVNAENVETELTTRGETVIRPMAQADFRQSNLPESFRGLKTTAYRVDTEEQAFGLRVLPQPRRVRTESTSEASWQNDRLQLVQRISFDVAYERLSQVRFTVPREVSTDRFRFFADNEVELPAEWSEVPNSQTRQVRLVLPEQKIGRFDIEAHFFVNMPDDTGLDGDATVAIPVLQCVDDPFHQTRIVLAREDWFEASSATEQWKPQPLRSESWTWLTEGTRPEFTLRIARSGGNANGTASVTKGLITAVFGQDGRAIVRAQFRIAVRSNSLSVALPASAEMQQFFWDRTALVHGLGAVEVPAGSRKYSLHLPEYRGDAADHLLTIDYQLPTAARYDFPSSTELQSPQLPQCAWDAHVVWQAVVLPDQHLLTHPGSASPMFRWRRLGLFWYRISDPDPSKLQTWIGANAGPDPEVAIDLNSPQLASNLYAFSQIGAPRPLTFRTLSSPMVLLFGAGISFVFGFILLRVRVLRHVLTVLTAGLILAAVGLWNAAPLELLLQPMIAGLLFPVMAVVIEGWFRRSYGATVLTLPTAAELAVAHGSRSEIEQPEAEEITTVRPPVHDSSQGVRVEAGSGVS